MKIAVYAICKNEVKFLDRWLKSMSEADYICVLDAGSTDGTWEALTRYAMGNEKFRVSKEVINPWRFDVARNESMKLIPSDIDLCVCTDLDEMFLPGWRDKLEAAWKPGATTARYEYVWNFNTDGSDGRKFLYEKIHRPGICRWTHPVHEILEYDVPKVFVNVTGMRLEHYADNTKSRASYLPLLEMSVAENPEDDRNIHYLGREYLFRGMYGKAVAALEQHLKMPTATWVPERAASMRFLARCWKAMNHSDKAELWYYRAIREASEFREAYVEMGQLMYEQNRWCECRDFCQKALNITRRDLSYITEPEAWGALPWDLLSLAEWNLGNSGAAIQCAKQALILAPTEERVRRNLEIMGRLA